MAEAIAVKFCTKGDYVKSYQGDDKSSLKGAWFCSRDPFCMHNCGLRKILHGSLLTTMNNVIDDRLLLIVPTVHEATLRLRPKLHRFDLHCSCCRVGCITYMW